MGKKKGLTIGKTRGALYGLAKFLGDVSAVKSGDPKTMGKHVGRRVAGKITGGFLGKLFR